MYSYFCEFYNSTSHTPNNAALHLRWTSTFTVTITTAKLHCKPRKTFGALTHVRATRQTTTNVRKRNGCVSSVFSQKRKTAPPGTFERKQRHETSQKRRRGVLSFKRFQNREKKTFSLWRIDRWSFAKDWGKPPRAPRGRNGQSKKHAFEAYSHAQSKNTREPPEVNPQQIANECFCDRPSWGPFATSSSKVHRRKTCSNVEKPAFYRA